MKYRQVVLLQMVKVFVILKYVDEPILDVQQKLGIFWHLIQNTRHLQ